MNMNLLYVLVKMRNCLVWVQETFHWKQKRKISVIYTHTALTNQPNFNPIFTISGSHKRFQFVSTNKIWRSLVQLLSCFQQSVRNIST